MPQNAFLRAEDLAVFDHVTRRLQLLTIHRPDREDYGAAVARIDAMEERLAGDPPPPPPRGVDGARWEPNVTKGQFHAMVDAAREYIMSGDAFQIVPSQRFRKPLAATAFDVYRCLRAINPSPYMFFLALGGDRHVVGTSPEKLVQVEGRRVETRPLAGTVSGAPKIRAMEVIAELEPEQRGVYAGSLGYVRFGGNLDMAITLRTVVVTEGDAYVQAGCGVVADSRPEREYEETLEKAGAMFKAIEMAEAM